MIGAISLKAITSWAASMVTYSQRQLLHSVRRAYSTAAEKPQDEHPFPVGRSFAESLGYPADLLSELPSVCVDAFAGVSKVAIFADIPPGAAVLDLGCGAGLDSLIAARRVGPRGKVVGVDFSQAMLARARRGSAEAGVRHLEFYHTEAGALPFADGQFDIALANGIFNLNPDREAIFRQLARVLRPGGAVYAAELILREPLPPEVRSSEISWFA